MATKSGNGDHFSTLSEILAIGMDPLEASAPAQIPPVPDAPTPERTPGPPFLSLQEAADWLCVSMSTVKRLLNSGQLHAVRIGRRRKIPTDCLTAYAMAGILLPNQIEPIG